MKRLACILIAIMFPLVCSGDGWFFSAGAGGGGTPTTVTWGLYELADFVPDSRSGNTSITDATLNGGGPTTSWVGFYVTASGTGSGSALITGWDDDTDTITCGAGLTLADDATITVGCRYTTGLQDCYALTTSSNLHKGSEAYLLMENDTTNSVYQHWLIYFPVHTDISASSITSATFYVKVLEEYVGAGTTSVMGKVVDGSASPNTTLWQEQANAFNQAATWDYKDDDTELDWEADSSSNVTDIFSAVESTAVDTNVGANWFSFNIKDLVEDWEVDGNTNLGMYSRVVQADTGAVKIGSKEATTETDRWIIKVTYE